MDNLTWEVRQPQACCGGSEQVEGTRAAGLLCQAPGRWLLAKHPGIAIPGHLGMRGAGAQGLWRAHYPRVLGDLQSSLLSVPVEFKTKTAAATLLQSSEEFPDLTLSTGTHKGASVFPHQEGDNAAGPEGAHSRLTPPAQVGSHLMLGFLPGLHSEEQSQQEPTHWPCILQGTCCAAHGSPGPRRSCP